MAFLKRIITLSPLYYIVFLSLFETWYPRLVPIQLGSIMAGLVFLGFFLSTRHKMAYISLAIITNEIFWLGLIYKLLTQQEVNALLKWIFWIAVFLFFGLIFSDKPLKKEALENKQFNS